MKKLRQGKLPRNMCVHSFKLTCSRKYWKNLQIKTDKTDKKEKQIR
jgi:hypothetical protein